MELLYMKLGRCLFAYVGFCTVFYHWLRGIAYVRGCASVHTSNFRVLMPLTLSRYWLRFNGSLSHTGAVMISTHIPAIQSCTAVRTAREWMVFDWPHGGRVVRNTKLWSFIWISVTQITIRVKAAFILSGFPLWKLQWLKSITNVTYFK